MSVDVTFIESYFKEEQIQSLFFIIIGVLSVALALIFLCIIKYSFFKGMAISLLLLGALQIIVGTTVYLRSPKDFIQVKNMIRDEQKKIKTEELPRIETVIKNFVTYQWIEIVLLSVSIIVFIRFYSSTQTFWKGLALGLLIQVSLILSLDKVAEKRATNYCQHLYGFNVKP